ncbi:TPA: hypothetical protein RNA82_004472 [Escherichia coli]|nr:hypothetical protein [Escherichia coli]
MSQTKDFNEQFYALYLARIAAHYGFFFSSSWSKDRKDSLIERYEEENGRDNALKADTKERVCRIMKLGHKAINKIKKVELSVKEECLYKAILAQQEKDQRRAQTRSYTAGFWSFKPYNVVLESDGEYNAIIEKLIDLELISAFPATSEKGALQYTFTK